MRRVACHSNLVEVRSDSANSVKIGGLAAPFDEVVIYQGKREKFDFKAFDNVLAGDKDVRLYKDHRYETDSLIATRKSQTLKLTKTSRGLEFEAVLPSPLTDQSKHLMSLINLGSIGASIGWQRSKHKTINGVRVWTDIDAKEISLTPIPAYKSTSVEQRKDKDHETWTSDFLFIFEAIKNRYAY